jgi:hypothetical protein
MHPPRRSPWRLDRLLYAAVYIALIAMTGVSGRAAAKPLIGAYVWGGYVDSAQGIESFYASVRLCLAHGLNLIRVNVDDFPGRADHCQNDDSLGCYARTQFSDPVWDDPSLKAVMLTAIDRSCNRLNGIHCFEPSWLASHSRQIINEYTGLFEVLYARFGSRQIQVILSNWEADNAINCGDAFHFGDSKGDFARNCNARYPEEIRTATARAHGLLQWFNLRDEAIRQFRATHPSFNLVQAPEFNIFRWFSSGCGGGCDGRTSAIIDQIEANGRRPYCSYSSYESQGPNYVEDIKQLSQRCEHLIIGEFGLDLNLVMPKVAKENFVRVAKAEPYVYAIVPWNAIDGVSGARYGLFSNTGAPQQFNFLGPLTDLLSQGKPLARR